MVSDLFGMKVRLQPQLRGYYLPEEIMPGLPWPPGFKEDFDKWSEAFYTPRDMFPGQMIILADGTTLLPEDAYHSLMSISAMSVGRIINIGEGP